MGRILRIRRFLLTTVGMTCVGLALLGVFLPLLPTTPFLLLAAACFMRSSKRLHSWLINHRLFGDYIRRYVSGQGLPLSAKIATIALMWTSLLASAIFVIPSHLWWVHIILLVVGIGVSIHLIRIKTYHPPKSDPQVARVERLHL